MHSIVLRWLSESRIPLQFKRCNFDPWIRKIPWRRHGSQLQYSCLFLPGESHGQRSLAGYNHRVAEWDMTEATEHTFAWRQRGSLGRQYMWSFIVLFQCGSQRQALVSLTPSTGLNTYIFSGLLLHPPNLINFILLITENLIFIVSQFPPFKVCLI